MKVLESSSHIQGLPVHDLWVKGCYGRGWFESGPIINMMLHSSNASKSIIYLRQKLNFTWCIWICSLRVFFFFLFFLKAAIGYSWFTMSCQFLLYGKVNQLHIYIYPLLFILFSHLGHHRVLSRAPCSSDLLRAHRSRCAQPLVGWDPGPFASACTWTDLSSCNKIQRNYMGTKNNCSMCSWGIFWTKRYKKITKPPPNCYFWRARSKKSVLFMPPALSTTKGVGETLKPALQPCPWTLPSSHPI